MTMLKAQYDTRGPVPQDVIRATILSARATPKWLLRRVSGAIVRRMG